MLIPKLQTFQQEKKTALKINKEFKSEEHELVIQLDPEHPVQ